MNLSIVIPCLNDEAECNATVKSIRETAGNEVEIIVIDDFSTKPLDLMDKGVTLIRNEYRVGVAASRQMGAIHASGELLMFLDSHMRFRPGWLDVLYKHTHKNNYTAWCCTCLGLDRDNMDVMKPRGEYNGATINFYGPDRNKAGAMQVFEGIWLDRPPKDKDPIPCLMGASYVLPKRFFMNIGGLELLRSWGSDEPYLSLKWWLAGGEIRMLRSIKIGHQFREHSTYRNDMWHLIYNKFMAMAICCPEVCDYLSSKLPITPETIYALQRVKEDSHLLYPAMARFASVKKRELPWYLDKFGIKIQQ